MFSINWSKLWLDGDAISVTYTNHSWPFSFAAHNNSGSVTWSTQLHVTQTCPRQNDPNLQLCKSMLLRSCTVPMTSSWLPHSKDSSAESESVLQLSRALSTPIQNLAEIYPRNQTPPICMSRSKVQQMKESGEVEETKQKVFKKKGKPPSVRELFSSSGLDEHEEDDGTGKRDSRLQTSVMGGGMGSGGGRICGGCNGSGRGSHGRDWTDAYYQNMIEANPNNALLLGNYAKFLKEVRGDYSKAGEYLERAILATPGDANVLSHYADLIWQTEKNADRAEGYFDQAVRSAPDDCYVLASYAKFLWDVEEDEEDTTTECQKKTDLGHAYPPDLFHETQDRPHVTAAFQSYLSE
ncbi:unnamed protein product [Sphenostylis stenocarpa]|uniref:Uncharacterized protein n=1 Tax=Sphenostylis stenocarpa TaxID=92480 RepID=A0AA86SE02_9FABA|nr:unnamed protein product [Sphenostylis stenocarpa]